MKNSLLWRNLVSVAGLRAVRAALAFLLGLVTVVGTSSAQAQAYKENVLYNFAGFPDGANPVADLIMDAKGNLYGTTMTGGTSDRGVVFKVSSKGAETVLHSFTGGTDGGEPYAGLIMDAKGNLYTTTGYAGIYAGCLEGCGTVFRMSGKGTDTTLYSFFQVGLVPTGRIPLQI